MRKGLFWEKDANKISAIIDAFDQLSDNSYIWVTNLKKHETWCTEKTQELFSLPDQIIPDFEQKLTEYLFPEDRPEYLQKIKQNMIDSVIETGETLISSMSLSEIKSLFDDE